MVMYLVDACEREPEMCAHLLASSAAACGLKVAHRKIE
jgi:hypothetical protein